MKNPKPSSELCCFPPPGVARLLCLMCMAALAAIPAASHAALQGYWTFEEGTGTTTADLSGNSLTGTLVNGPVWTNSPLGTNCLFFDGSNDRVSLGNPTNLQFTGAMTISAWVYPRGFSDSGRIFTRGGNSGSRGYALNVENTAGPGKAGSFQVPSSGSALVSVNTTMSLTSNQWIHLTGVFEPGVAVRIYTNGFLNNSTATAVATLFNNSLNATIGSRPDGSTKFFGLIDNVRAYNEALTEAQIQALPELVQTPLAFKVQPSSRLIIENQPVTFQCTFTGAPPYYIQWYENDILLPDVKGLTYTIPSVQQSMNGNTYRVSVSNLVYGITSTNAVLTVSNDTNAPALVSVGSVDGNYVGVCFNEPMDQSLLWDPAHFTVNGGAVSVTGSSPRPDGYGALISLSAPVSSGYAVAVSGLTDLVGNPIAPGSTATGMVENLSAADFGAPLPAQIGETFSCRSNTFEITAGGTDIWNTTDFGHFASRTISGSFDVRVNLTSLTTPSSSAKAGIMLRQTLDANSPTIHILANAPLPAGAGNITAGVRATTGGGTAYMGLVGGAVTPDVWMRLRRWGDQFTAFHSTNGVDWVVLGTTTLALTDQVNLGLAACSHTAADATLAKLQSYDSVVFTNVTLAFSQTPTNITAEQNTIVTFNAQADGTGAPASELAYQWQLDGGSGFTNIPGAQASALSFLALPGYNGNQLRVQAYFAGLISNSPAATLSLTPDATVPTVVSVTAVGDPTKITVLFSEDMNAASAANTVNYQLTASGTPPGISTAEVGANARTIILTTSGPLYEGTNYTLTIQNVLDLGVPANSVANTQKQFQYSSLIGYWKLEEGTGATTADSSGNGLHGTLTGTPLPTWVTPGWLGASALEFPGNTDSRVTIGNSPLVQITGPLTLMAWAYPVSTSNGGRIVTKGGNSGDRGWSLNVENTGIWRMQIPASSTTLVSCSTDPGTVALGTWTHVAAVYDPNDSGGPTMKFYTNGVLAPTTITGGTVPSSMYNPANISVAIGARSDGTTRWQGRIDEVRIYSRALGDAEIATLATPPVAPPSFLPPVLLGNELILDWTGVGQLQSAPTVIGVYTNITPAPVPPYTNVIVPGGNQFFRIVP